MHATQTTLGIWFINPDDKPEAFSLTGGKVTPILRGLLLKRNGTVESCMSNHRGERVAACAELSPSAYRAIYRRLEDLFDAQHDAEWDTWRRHHLLQDELDSIRELLSQ